MMATPKIRFKGFAGDWEQRKLGEVARFRDGERRPLESGDRANRQGEYPYYGASGIIDYIDDYIFDEPLILLGEDGANILNRSTPLAFIARGKYWVNNHAHVIEPLAEHDICFVCEALEKIDYSIYNTGTAQPKLNQEVCQKIPFFVTCKPEQTAIGNFFRTLDDTITLHKRKLDGLKELKKGYLQQMFPRTGDSVPRVRFAGFSGDWKTRKLGEVFEQTAKFVNPKEDDIELWSLTVENGLTPKTERYNREFLVKKDDSYKSVAPYEFVYNPMNMTLGAVDLNLLNKNVAISGYYITMRANEDYDNNYFAIWLKSASAIELYKIYATGGLIEKQRVQFPTLSQIMTLVPSKAEQTAIGSFFSNLDEQIATQQTKLDKLKQLKAAYLQRMFV